MSSDGFTVVSNKRNGRKTKVSNTELSPAVARASLPTRSGGTRATGGITVEPSTHPSKRGNIKPMQEQHKPKYQGNINHRTNFTKNGRRNVQRQEAKPSVVDNVKQTNQTIISLGKFQALAEMCDEKSFEMDPESLTTTPHDVGVEKEEEQPKVKEVVSIAQIVSLDKSEGSGEYEVSVSFNSDGMPIMSKEMEQIKSFTSLKINIQ